MRWPMVRWALMRHLEWSSWCGANKKKLNWQRFTGVLLKDHLEETYGNILEYIRMSYRVIQVLCRRTCALPTQFIWAFWQGRTTVCHWHSLAPPMIRFMWFIYGSTTRSCLNCFIWGRNSRVPDSSLGKPRSSAEAVAMQKAKDFAIQTITITMITTFQFSVNTCQYFCLN